MEEITLIEMINILAIILSPVVAVLITIYLQNCLERKKEKIAIIKALLSTGHYLYSDEIIRSYNLIDIVFKDDKEVREKWKLYFEALGNEALNTQIRYDKKLDLILAMCKVVKYKNITAQDLQRVYVPRGFVEDGTKQREFNDMLYTIAKGFSQFIESTPVTSSK